MTNPQDGSPNPQDRSPNSNDESPPAADQIVLAESETELVNQIVEVLQSKMAEDLLLMDLRDVTDVADFFLLATGTSDMHIRSLADELVERLEAHGERPWHVEGKEQCRWILIDLVHVVIHLFSPEAREYYGLERLWGDARTMRFEDTGIAGPATATPIQ